MSDKELSSKIKELNIPKERIVKFACDCALVNIELIKPYTHYEDYQELVTFLKHPACADARSDAAHAASVAADAASVANYVANYTASAAGSAARAASFAVSAAANAANAAANAANAAADAADAADAAGNSEKFDTLIDELFAEFE